MTFKSLFIPLLLVTSLLQLSLAHQLEKRGKQRKLLGFKEKTFQCSPSGPCLPCLYSEKGQNVQKFLLFVYKYEANSFLGHFKMETWPIMLRLGGETGYRIPFKCLKIGDTSKEANGKGSLGGTSAKADKPTVKHRTLEDSTSVQVVESQEYVTYRSCIQGVNEEKLSVLGFEVLMLGLLLVSGSFVLFRQKKTVAMAGVGGVRVQSNSRF